MKIVVDENIPNITVEEFRRMGHDVLDIRGTERQGMFDNDLWALAQTEQRALVATDKGFQPTAITRTTVSWSCVCVSPMNNVSTHESWLRFDSSLSPNGLVYPWSCARRCRVSTERELQQKIAEPSGWRQRRGRCPAYSWRSLARRASAGTLCPEAGYDRIVS